MNDTITSPSSAGWPPCGAGSRSAASMLEDTRFGFIWDQVSVERLADDPKLGWYIRISHARSRKFIDVRVTPGGQRIDVEPGQYDKPLADL